MSKRSIPFVIEIPGELELSQAQIKKLERAVRDDVINVLNARQERVITNDETNINPSVVVVSQVQRGRARRSSAGKGGGGRGRESSAKKGRKGGQK